MEMLERANIKILRTIQGLPVRCPKEGMALYLDAPPLLPSFLGRNSPFSSQLLPFLMQLCQSRSSSAGSRSPMQKLGSPCWKPRW